MTHLNPADVVPNADDILRFTRSLCTPDEASVALLYAAGKACEADSSEQPVCDRFLISGVSRALMVDYAKNPHPYVVMMSVIQSVAGSCQIGQPDNPDFVFELLLRSAVAYAHHSTDLTPEKIEERFKDAMSCA